MLKRYGVLRAAIFGSVFACASAASEGCSDGSNDVAPITLPHNGSGGEQGAGGAPRVPRDMSVPAVQARVRATLDELAALGPKRAGTEGGLAAGDYVKRRLEAAIGREAKFEPFSFRYHNLGSSSLGVFVDGQKVEMAHEVFAYSGVGSADADVVDVGKGHEADYEGKSVEGKIVFVVRDPTFHRQAQYRVALKHGAVGLLLASQSPHNLIQIGTIHDSEDGLARMPTVAVGKEDGAKLQQAFADGKPVRAALNVDATLQPAAGRNVIVDLPGTDPSGAYLLLGAHYDTWQIGSTDNGTGVAALLELAERLGEGPPRRLGVKIVGFDAEELGLFGAYDFLRRHVIIGQEPMLGFLNLEMPAGGPPSGGGLRAIASTNAGPIVPASAEGGLGTLYTLTAGLEMVPQLFGGLIPTDVQGMYWYGLQGLTTYCETDYYHTVEDTPDKVDTEFLAQVSLALFDTMRALDDEPVQSYKVRDSQLWDPRVATAPSPTGGLDVTVTAQNIEGAVQPGALVRVWVDVDDFTRVFDTLDQPADGAGKFTIKVPSEVLATDRGRRWLHVTAGKTYPLAEQILPLP